MQGKIHKLSASHIFIDGKFKSDTVLLINEDGKILSIDPISSHDTAEVDVKKGALIPGFVNTHCHLELSHMKAKVDTGTGLIPFIQSVVQFRDIDQAVIDEAIRLADKEMADNGIVAVGDISNKADTIKVKASSDIHYLSFIEAFDFLDDQKCDEYFNPYHSVYKEYQQAGLDCSMVPHAPYSVSKTLFEKINQVNEENSFPVSIHNQETLHENQFFLDKTGDLLKFYGGFQLPIDHFTPTGETSTPYAMRYMDASRKTIFVHNTIMSKEDIQATMKWSPNVFFATCANANLYIENKLPHYKDFIDANATMTIGTDSLTSNWQLSILDEMQTIQQYQSYIKTEELISWATINGAKALSMDESLGSFEVGKSPGVNLLHGSDDDDYSDLQKTSVTPVFNVVGK